MYMYILFCTSINSCLSLSLKWVYVPIYPCCENGWICRHMPRNIVVFIVLLCSFFIQVEIKLIASELRYCWSILSSFGYPVFTRKSFFWSTVLENNNFDTSFLAISWMKTHARRVSVAEVRMRMLIVVFN